MKSGWKWVGVAASAVLVYAIVTSWPELVRYRRMMAM
jgi:hypothetical protein